MLTPTPTKAGDEIWRGCCQAWDCDEMGHQNVRFFVTQAMEGLAELLARLGIPTRARHADDRTVFVREHRLRLLREVRAGTAIHMRGGIVDCTEASARVAQILYHSDDGQISATFMADIDCISADGAVCAWPAGFAGRAGIMPIPATCLPRGLTTPIDTRLPSGARADALGMMCVGGGIVRDDSCDRTGRMHTDQFIARISDGTRSITTAFHRAAAAADGAPERIGSAGVEVRVRYFVHPQAGDRYTVRAGLAEVNDRTRRTVYWMLNAASGAAFAALESMEVLLDLDARRSFSLSPAAADALRSQVIAFDRAKAG